MNETFTVERLVGGAMKITSDSAWLPGGVMVVRSGEQFTLEMPGLGVTTVRETVSSHMGVMSLTLGHNVTFVNLILIGLSRYFH